MKNEFKIKIRLWHILKEDKEARELPREDRMIMQ
jgi:hypothetical protein